MANKPVVQHMIDELVSVVDKYRCEGISYCEVIGCLEIISRDIYIELTSDEEEDHF